ncbi:uncharacterized protein B4U79_05761 [Dinothrombium tinctorium]|uniref:FZ domain-containing protein n=2 Tax=Dinothrombium tinctorium TaxID=1965070 RepID=A0A443R647_9ACAR|nr:uncharacterized protein B4U79_05761 [Dinothrombium tinctorium]
MLVPFYSQGINVKPCRSLCERVEQKCPYLHPASGEQYAGEPVFICIDPRIPESQNATDLPYGKPGKCYDLCDLATDDVLDTKNDIIWF